MQPTWWDILLQWVELIANGASVVTAIFAFLLWGKLKADDGTRMRKLEGYLETERRSGGNYQHSVLHLSGRLGMTEAQVFEAAVASSKIEKVLGHDEQGFANRILFQYTTGDAERDLELEGLTPRRARQGTAPK